jgi:thiamine pyrophosphate-dependent acetolactate synthase large subunit-like protein
LQSEGEGNRKVAQELGKNLEERFEGANKNIAERIQNFINEVGGKINRKVDKQDVDEALVKVRGDITRIIEEEAKRKEAEDRRKREEEEARKKREEEEERRRKEEEEKKYPGKVCKV